MQLVYKFGNISSEILSGSIGVYFSHASFDINRRAETHKLK